MSTWNSRARIVFKEDDARADGRSSRSVARGRNRMIAFAARYLASTATRIVSSKSATGIGRPIA
jgi:hypothetical protein